MDARLELLTQFKPLYTSDSRYYFLSSGRGAGKSFAVADFLLKLTYDGPHTILYTRYTMVSAQISILPEFTQKIEAYGLHDVFEVTQNEIINKRTGANILFKGIKTSSGNQTAALKSIANVSTVVFEEMEDLHDESVFDTIDLSVRHKTLQNRVICILNPTYKTHWTYKRFFKTKNLKHNFNGTKDGCTYIFTSYLDNKKNLPDSYLEQAERTRLSNPIRYNHIFLGEWLDDAEGLLWNRGIISRTRIDKAPKLNRIIVSIDPAVTAKADSDETGIVVLGTCERGFGYVLDDASGRYTPNQWATEAMRMAEKWNATAYIAEKNQGGDMVEAVIKQHDKTRRIKLVTATKGKYLRAEPVFNLYEQNRIMHVGEFARLEQQMITFNPDSMTGSPDRVDALVHGLTDLMMKPRKTLSVSFA